MVKNPPAVQVKQETQVQFLVLEDPLEKEMATHSSILYTYIYICFWGFPGSSAGKEFPCNAETWETWVQCLGWKDPLEKGMTTHSSILAWVILWAKKPSGLQPMGLQSHTQLTD